jgi:hypothetical protein
VELRDKAGQSPERRSFPGPANRRVMKTVVIHVKKGLAYIEEKPAGIEVVVVDYDTQDNEPDIARYEACTEYREGQWVVKGERHGKKRVRSIV